MWGLSWQEVSSILSATPPGNAGRLLLPWFEPEITPPVSEPGIRRYGLAEHDRDGHVRGLIEAQMMSMALHSGWMGVSIDTIHATGGAAANREILQVMADVFGADVYQFEVGNSASLGAALRAAEAHARAEGVPTTWEDILRGLAEPDAASRIVPRRHHTELYAQLMRVYQACEAHALGLGPPPGLATAFGAAG
jgi:xylulokinase